MNDSVTVIDIVAQVTDETSSGARSAEANVCRLERSMMSLQKQILGMKGKSKLEVAATLKDMASRGIQNVANAGKKLAGKVWTVTLKAVDLVTAPFKKILGLVANPIAGVVAFAGISLGIADTLNTFKSFEQGMANVKAISGASGREFDELTNTAKHLGETTMFSAAQAAEAMENLAMAGWKSKDIIAGMPGLLDLAASGSVDLATAADVTSSALAQFNLAASESTHVADVLAATATNSKTDVAGLGESLKMAGTQAGALGYSIEDTALALGLMGNAGVDASSAGTALRSTLARMAKQEGLSAEESNAVTKAMRDVGVSLTDAEGNSKSLLNVMKELRKGFQGMTETEKAATASNLAGMYAQSGLLAIVNASEEKFNQLAAAIDNAQGSAAKMAKTRMDTIQGSLLLLQSAAEGVKIAIGEKLQPYVRQLIDWVTAHMPDIQNAVGSAVDFVLGKIDSITASIQDMTNSPAWQNAETLWDKLKLAWNKLIAEPFDDWWNSSGKPWLAEKAQSIGNGIGSALKTGILTLLGVDPRGALTDGADIGKSFADGFLEGFDGAKVGEALAKAIQSGLKTLALDAATLLPGGKEATATSSLSAALLGYGAFKTTMLGYGALKALWNGVKTVGGVASGVNAYNVAANGGIAETVRLGVAQSGRAGAAASFGATIAPAVNSLAKAVPVIAGVTSTIQSITDMYHGWKNAEEWTGSDSSRAQWISGFSAILGGLGDGVLGKESTGRKVSNVAGGALKGAGFGAMLGSIIPGAGTAVGAGIGAVAGAGLAAIGGSNIAKVLSGYNKKEHDKALADAQADQKSALEAEKAKYNSQELKNALGDASVSAEDFAKMLEKAVRTDIAKHFGNVALSAKEITEIASSVTNMKDADAASTFQNTSANKQAAYQAITTHAGNLSMLDWKIGLGFELSESDRGYWAQELNSIYDSAKDYLDNAHFEATAAVKLLVGPDSEFDLSGLDAVYSSLTEQLQGLGEQYKGKIKLALGDGVITLDEQAEIQNLQDQITAITNEVSEIETAANLKALQIKYSGAALDADSFAALQAELASQVQNASSAYDKALQVSIQSLELQLSKGAIDPDQYDAQLQTLADSYDAKISALHLSVEKFQLESIADAYANELEGILPEMQGTTAEKLRTAIENAITAGVDVTSWDSDTAAKWLGLDSLSKETQTAIASLVSSVAETFPKSLSKAASKDTNDLKTGFTGTFPNAKVGEGIAQNLAQEILNAGMGPVQNAADTFKTNAGNILESAFQDGFDLRTSVRLTADYSFLNPVPSIQMYNRTAAFLSGVDKNAKGNIVASPRLSLIGEDGPEAIIPLSGKYRDRGLDLWEHAGELLGVRQYAEGGIAGDNTPEPVNAPAPLHADGVIAPVTVENLNVEINVDGGNTQNPQELAAAIREHIRGISDDIAYQLAAALQQAYANMPTEGWH